MGSLKKDIGGVHPEQRQLLEIFEKAGQRHNYYDVFSTLIDFCLHQYTAPENLHAKDDFIFPSQYNTTEQAYFKTMLREVQSICYKYCSLWNGVSSWYDPFGNLFESVSSDFSKQRAGQFFTPPSICDLMAQIIVEKPTAQNIGNTCVDPCCGSGRLLLASNAINAGLYHIGNDIDPLCTKMTALNFCLNGVIGEVSCNNALQATSNNFRFGFKIVPLMSLFNNELSKLIFALNPTYRRQYCILPLPFESCLIQQNEEKREFFNAHVQTHVEHRNEIHPEGLQGILFEAEKINKEKKKTIAKESSKQKLSTEEKFNLLFNL